MTFGKAITILAAGLFQCLALSAREDLTVIQEKAYPDTLQVGDGRLRIVLEDDHSWHFVKDSDALSEDDVFKNNWVIGSLDPYEGISISQLPEHNSICLVDSASVFVCPYQTKVFSKFGWRHGHRHQGVDLPLAVGTPVVCAFDGRVRVSTTAPGYGNIVVVRHENGLETYYGCLSKREVEEGDWVHAGDLVGLGGTTGLASGAHLNFEMRYQGYAIDPELLVDFEKGKLLSNVFVLRRNSLDTSSRYIPGSIDEEEEIYAGDERLAAEEARIAAEKAAIRYHKVKQGDTVSAICHKYGISMSKIKSLNPKLNVDKISLGQNIRVN